VLSRGIDVEGIDLVINYDVPSDPEDYIHRIGRTARAATTGTAITFVNERDQRKLQNIEKMIDRALPEHPVPAEYGEVPPFRAVGTFSEGNRRGGSGSGGHKPGGHRGGSGKGGGNWKSRKPRPGA